MTGHTPWRDIAHKSSDRDLALEAANRIIHEAYDGTPEEKQAAIREDAQMVANAYFLLRTE